jgi:glycosyltransferase involved in cell wall biosynthesis
MLNRGAHDWLHVARALEDAVQGEYDIVHNHAGELALAFLRLVDVPALSTMHYIPKPDSLPIWDDATGWYNTLSRSHLRGHPPLRRPVHAGHVYHGIDTEAYPFSAEKDDYLLFLSRIAPAKGVHLAVDVARSLGKRLVIAGKVDRAHPVDGPYYSHVVEPLIDGHDVDFEGEVDTQRKLELFRRAQALLLPLQWDEPFGLVMIEAMACGTAVIALNRGAAPEVIAHGATGYVVEDLAQMREAVERVSEIDPYQCRSHVREHFEATIMTKRYVSVYRAILGC